MNRKECSSVTKINFFYDKSAITAFATGGPRYSRLLKFDILFDGFGKKEKTANEKYRT
jgi:hypothetical protein